MESTNNENTAKQEPKGKIISQRIILIGGILFLAANMLKSVIGQTICTAALCLGLGIVLAGNLYRFYHFKTYKRYNILAIIGLTAAIGIVLISKYIK